jgi:hypothetical protein
VKKALHGLPTRKFPENATCENCFEKSQENIHRLHDPALLNLFSEDQKDIRGTYDCATAE